MCNELSKWLTEEIGSKISIGDDKFVFLNESNQPLLYSGRIPSRPVLTLDTSSKWYQLYVITTTGAVHGLRDWDILDSQYYHYRDDKWHPKTIEFLGEALGCDVCEETIELAIGRWHLEVAEDYSYRRDEREEQLSKEQLIAKPTVPLTPEEAKAARERVEQKIKQNAWAGAMSGPADFKGFGRDEVPIIASTDQKS